jgi:hypothetical protein
MHQSFGHVVTAKATVDEAQDPQRSQQTPELGLLAAAADQAVIRATLADDIPAAIATTGMSSLRVAGCSQRGTR